MRPKRPAMGVAPRTWHETVDAAIELYARTGVKHTVYFDWDSWFLTVSETPRQAYVRISIGVSESIRARIAASRTIPVVVTIGPRGTAKWAATCRTAEHAYELCAMFDRDMPELAPHLPRWWSQQMADQGQARDTQEWLARQPATQQPTAA